MNENTVVLMQEIVGVVYDDRIPKYRQVDREKTQFLMQNWCVCMLNENTVAFMQENWWCEYDEYRNIECEKLDF